MAKDPAFLFYSQDFIVGVQTMNYEDRGKYITILCQMHQQGRMDEESICFLVGSVSVKLKSKFIVDDKGLWYNLRLEEESEKRNEYAESRRKNGSLGGRPKAYAKPTRKHMDKHMPNHMEDVNEDVNEDKDKSKIKNEVVKIAEEKIKVRETVSLTQDQIGKLGERFGEAYEWALDQLENHKQKTGAKYKSDYHAIIGWVFEKYEKELNSKKNAKPTNDQTNRHIDLFKETIEARVRRTGSIGGQEPAQDQAGGLR